MKKKLAEKILKEVVGFFPGKQLQVRGNLLFETPIRDVLCGLCLENSGFSADVFQPSVFVQPIFERSSHLVLSLGERFLGKWNVREPDLVEHLIQQMNTVGFSVWDIYGSAERLCDLPVDERLPLRSIVSGYALILTKRFDEAVKRLQTADEHNEQIYGTQMKANPSFWPNNRHREIADMIDRLRNNPQEAIQTLSEWRQFTLKELRLSEFAVQVPSHTS